MTVLKIGFPYLGVQPHWQLFITGIILIVAVFVDILNERKIRRLMMKSLKRINYNGISCSIIQ